MSEDQTLVELLECQFLEEGRCTWRHCVHCRAADRIESQADEIKRLSDGAKIIMHSAPPGDWESTDHYGDYVGYGENPSDPDYVDDVDHSNNGDVHDHGFSVGWWAAACALREALSPPTQTPGEKTP